MSAAFARSSSVRTVSYHGIAVRIPRSWPVINLSRDPHACVRFDRHALYLGTPSATENCPARAVGRTEALLIEPRPTQALGLAPQGGDATTFAIPSAGVEVTATWSHAPGVVARALGRRSLPRATSTQAGTAVTPSVRQATPIYTGLGFDRCSAPSTSQMSAWRASPYRAVGIYVGGVNTACLQRNLTPGWVSHEIAAGWHPIPIYVGLQAPSNGCGCQAMSAKTSTAAAQGRAAAADAVTQAQHLGIPPGNAIYNDLEGYTRSTTNTHAVLAFLAGWTTKLHTDGYLSGVYSGASSGIVDLAAKYGKSYREPDDIWFADWNGLRSTNDPYVPRRDWVHHQRLHQYKGGSTETYGKVTLNIDDDYLDGATAFGRDGYSLLTSDGGVHTFGAAVSYGSDTGKLAPGVTAVSLAVNPGTGGYWILTSDGGVDNFNAPPHGSLKGSLAGLTPIAIAAPPEGGYLILTSDGGVHPFGRASWYGSDAGKLPTGVTAVGFAVNPRSHGYWILKSNGGVDPFHAPWNGSLNHKLGASVPTGIAAPPHGGYLILTSNGGAHAFGPAVFYGSDVGKLPRGVTAVALSTSPKLAGYRILRSDGGVDSFDATWAGSLLRALPTGVSAAALVSGG